MFIINIPLVLASLVEYDYPHLEEYYQKLRLMDKPSLILWGRQDQVYTAEGAEYFGQLLPKVKTIIFEDCDIVTRKMGNTLNNSADKKYQPSPFEVMWREKREQAMLFKYVPGQASDFYFYCRNGEFDKVLEVINAENALSIEQLNEVQPNGSTALHTATYYGHRDIVKLLLDRNCPRSTLNKFGRTAYEEAQSPEMKQLFERPDFPDRFHELDTAQVIDIYLPEEDNANPAINETQDFVQVFKTDAEIFEYSLNTETIAMWFKYFTWFTHKFHTFIERDDFHIDQSDLYKHEDFQQFLKNNLTDPDHYQITTKSINEARQRKSIEPLITLYTNEYAGFYQPFNQQLARSTNDAQKSSHLCDRFILEFHTHHHELKKRAFTGIIYRGATLSITDLMVYERARFSAPSGVLGLKAFTSTSTDPLVALVFATRNPPTDDKKNVLFIFEVLKVTPTIFGIEDISQYTHEHEVLVLPGNLFIVTNIQEDRNLKVTKIYLRHWNVPITFWAKLKHTFQAGQTNVL
ncbi:unnamed protein product [Adineta steineri]|uniref:Uncharacterized protein n=1 Tax=Adineta steineri TaxID=433720 RepID=A0A819FYS1_9BILA|nr:unnamed protein product [Adineta steineri]CAF3873478.1 unnamed protein product [Adineta steineri]